MAKTDMTGVLDKITKLIEKKPDTIERLVEANNRQYRLITDFSQMKRGLIELALVLDQAPEIIEEFFGLFPASVDMVDERLTVNESSAGGAIEQRLVFKLSSRLLDWMATTRAGEAVELISGK